MEHTCFACSLLLHVLQEWSLQWLGFIHLVLIWESGGFESRHSLYTLWMIPDLYEMQGTIYWVLGFTRHYRRLPGSSGIYGEFLRNPQVWNLGRKIRRPKKCMAWGGQKINESNPAFHTYKKHPSSKMNDRVIYYNHNILQLCLIHRFTFI